MGSIVTIVCSDVTRNGKTLLARIYADIYSLRKIRSPLIFDTDLSGNGIINYLPDKTQPIDLSRVADQVALFDSMLDIASSDREMDFVVDIAANELNRFFRIFSDIGFERGAFEAKLDIQVCHLISWTFKSLQVAGNIRDILTTGRFIAVRNMAMEALPFTPSPEEEALIPNIPIDLFLLALSPQTFRTIDDKDFSFARFIEGEYDNLDYELRSEIWNFLENVRNQMKTS